MTRVVASYCTTFLKPEMLHVYRQVSGLERWRTFVITRERQCADRYPFEDVEIVPRVRSNFVRRFWLKYIRREPPIVYRGEYGALANLLARREADLLHVYFGHTGVHLLPFLKRWPKPAVVSFHGMDVMTRDDRPGYAEKLRELLQFLPVVMARSHSLAGRLVELGCPPERIRLNRTGIPMDRFPEVRREFPADGRWRFVQACRLVEKKGLGDSLRAFAAFCQDHPESTFTIAGEGPLRAELENLAAQLGVSGKVSFTGFLGSDDLCRLFHESHVFLHPSFTTEDRNQEGVPNSMLEAMATGLPVVATHHGGIPEAVEDGRSGLLAEERDGDRLLDNLRRLAASHDLWRRIGEAAARDVRENFEQRAQIRRLEAIYDEAAGLEAPN